MDYLRENAKSARLTTNRNDTRQEHERKKERTRNLLRWSKYCCSGYVVANGLMRPLSGTRNSSASSEAGRARPTPGPAASASKGARIIFESTRCDVNVESQDTTPLIAQISSNPKFLKTWMTSVRQY